MIQLDFSAKIKEFRSIVPFCQSGLSLFETSVSKTMLRQSPKPIWVSWQTRLLHRHSPENKKCITFSKFRKEITWIIPYIPANPKDEISTKLINHIWIWSIPHLSLQDPLCLSSLKLTTPQQWLCPLSLPSHTLSSVVSILLLTLMLFSFSASSLAWWVFHRKPFHLYCITGYHKDFPFPCSGWLSPSLSCTSLSNLSPPPPNSGWENWLPVNSGTGSILVCCSSSAGFHGRWAWLTVEMTPR